MKTTLHMASVVPNGMFTGPFCIPADPVKSTVKASSPMLTVAFIHVGPSEHYAVITTIDVEGALEDVVMSGFTAEEARLLQARGSRGPPTLAA